jgi:hypothetical protein
VSGCCEHGNELVGSKKCWGISRAGEQVAVSEGLRSVHMFAVVCCLCCLLVKQVDPNSDTCKLYPRVGRLESVSEHQLS